MGRSAKTSSRSCAARPRRSARTTLTLSTPPCPKQQPPFWFWPSLRQWRHERGRFFVLTQRGGKVAYLVVPSRTQTQYAAADSAATVAAQSNAPGLSWGANFAEWFFVGIRKSFGKSLGYSQAPTGRI